ncbi:putative ATP-dependent DNA helicase [Blattamonas nauphoetae]|nr:putative ATP-dependent DNA helicase [Blattamonas nauphoetae]
MNEEIIKRVPGQFKDYFSLDSAVYDNPQTDTVCYTTEFMNSLTPSGLPPHHLQLKEGAIVMLLRNLDIENGLCNGTRLIISQMGTKILQCSYANEPERKCFLTPITTSHRDGSLPFELIRVQFPIRLSFAMTINKAQGQSFSTVGIHIPSPLFNHGQLYVAMSRCRSAEGLKIAIPNTRENRFSRVKNVVYQELLQG